MPLPPNWQTWRGTAAECYRLRPLPGGFEFYRVGRPFQRFRGRRYGIRVIPGWHRERTRRRRRARSIYGYLQNYPSNLNRY